MSGKSKIGLAMMTDLLECGHPKACVMRNETFTAPFIWNYHCGWCADIERQKQATYDYCRAAHEERLVEIVGGLADQVNLIIRNEMEIMKIK